MLDCSHISTADFTAAKGFKAMITDFKRRNQQIIFYNTSSSVIDTFSGVNMEEFVIVHSVEELNEYLKGTYPGLYILVLQGIPGKHGFNQHGPWFNTGFF